MAARAVGGGRGLRMALEPNGGEETAEGQALGRALRPGLYPKDYVDCEGVPPHLLLAGG